MKKKDYELIANQIDMAIYDVRKTEEQRKVLRDFAHQLAGRLEITEHKFDKQKFLAACGIETNGFEIAKAEYNAKLDSQKV